MIRLLIFFVITALGLPANADASPPPIPQNKSEALGSFKDRIEIENKEKSALQKRIKSIDNDLSTTKNKLISVAKAIQKNEADLKIFEQKITNMELKKAILDDKLKSDRSSIAKLILALERIRRTPPEAMLAMPEAPYKTAQSAMLMGSIIPSINRHAAKLNKNLETLDSVTKQLGSEKTALLSVSKTLELSHDELSRLLLKRKQLYTQTNNDLKSREITIQKISLQASNLEDLVAKIKEDEAKEIERMKKANITRKNQQQKIIDDGNARLPISGIIRTAYKQRDNLGASSKGLTIEGRSNSIVVAPMGGKVQFTGSFKRYGNIVIIEHVNNYHSLIAGLGDITTIVGDYIKSGEPIGILPNSSLIPRPTLYYELRKNGNPVNPAIKFPDLG